MVVWGYLVSGVGNSSCGNVSPHTHVAVNVVVLVLVFVVVVVVLWEVVVIVVIVVGSNSVMRQNGEK